MDYSLTVNESAPWMHLKRTKKFDPPSSFPTRPHQVSGLKLGVCSWELYSRYLTLRSVFNEFSDNCLNFIQQFIQFSSLPKQTFNRGNRANLDCYLRPAEHQDCLFPLFLSLSLHSKNDFVNSTMTLASAHAS